VFDRNKHEVVFEFGLGLEISAVHILLVLCVIFVYNLVTINQLIKWNMLSLT